MSNSATTQQQLEELASRLQGSHPTAAEHIHDLAESLGNGVIDRWRDIDLNRVIDADAIAEGLKARMVPGGGIRFCEWLRNVLIFVPIALTWWSISQATSSYSKLLAADSAHKFVGWPFLYLWQQGFNGTLSPLLILSNVALIDCVLLGLIVGLTFFVNWRYNITNAAREKEAEELRDEIAQELGSAYLCLQEIQRQQLMQAPPKDIEGAMRQLSTFTSDFKRITDEILRELAAERQQRGSLQDFTQALDTISKEMLNAARTMQHTNAELVDTIRDISAPIRAIPDLIRTGSQALTTLNSISSSLQNLASEQQRVLQQVNSEQRTIASDIENATEEIQQTLEELRDNAKLLHTLISQQKSITDELDQHAKSQAQAMDKIRDAATNVNALMKGTRDSIPELRSIAVSTDKLVSALKDIPTVLQNELLQPLKHYSNAAAKINVGADKLEQSANALYAATSRLNGTNLHP